ncbi:MAG: Dihydrolipoamide acetyltransferase component of pyruvate dehydrogenase complex [Gammaproteobacteria bacterium]|nr:Dihydrolipoamide acetyltransferase component of pyruvate dehydrogenase complex [Gammaproteobacteria bacterium]
MAELESSKIVNTLESHVSGVVYRKLAREDDTLPVGSLLAVVAEAGATAAEIEAYINNFTSESRATISGTTEKTTPVPSKAPVAVSQPSPEGIDAVAVPDHLQQGPDDSNVPAAPHARRLAQKLGINLHNITGSGRHGRIAIADIEQAIARGSLAAPAVVEEVPLSGTRLTIARRLQESKSTIPHYRLIADVRVDALSALRTQLTASLNQDLSLNDMLLKACATALLKVPACNVQLENNIIRKFTDADIAVAVALESGLITPIIRSVNRKGVAQIASEARDLIDRAKTGRLSLEEISGGTFTISNLGMFGIKQFDAIINPPQCAILAVGCAEQRVVVESGRPAVATVMSVSLSLDHRVIDGAVGAGFLRELAQVIEHPETALWT